MLGFNWVDAVIVVLLALAAWEGVRIGILTQLCVIIGFFAALFLAGWLVPFAVRFHNPTLRTIANAGLVLVLALYAAMRSFDAAQRIHWSFRFGGLTRHTGFKKVETVLGSVPGVLAGLAVVWLFGVAIGRMPFAGLSNSVSDARIVQLLTRALPPAPAVFAAFNRRIDPNAQPNVFITPKSQPDFSYSNTDFMAATAAAQASVVRVTSFGCGGIIDASGFVAGKELVVTNAHVVAGVKRPIVKYGGRSYAATPVYFDQLLDLAILRVAKLPAPALTLAPATASLNSTVAVLGYPGGNYRAVPGILRDTLAVSATSIYDQGSYGRGIYVVQAPGVEYGSSGGPVVLPNGQAVGVIFAQSVDSPQNAFALTSAHILPAVHKAQSSHQSVGTGACMV